MRDGYDAFRATQDDLPDPGELLNVKITLNAPYELQGYDPDLNYKAKHFFKADWQAQELPMPVLEKASVSLETFVELEGDAPLVIRSQPTAVVPQWDIPLPNSIMTVTIQHLTLSDNDVILNGYDYEFVDPWVYTTVLEDLVEIAEQLSLGLSAIIEPGHMPTVEEVKQFFEKALTAEASAPAGASVSVKVGGEASGIVINGVYSEEMPDFMENLPAALQEDEDEEDAEADPEGPDNESNPFAEEEEANPYELDPGHHVMAGGNISANEAFIGMSWVDAGVIAVMGDVVRLDLISQTNVLSDVDGGSAGAASRAVNAARIEQVSSNPGGAKADPVDDPVFPSFWQVQTVEGDVISLNWTQQHIFATDNDRAEIEFTGDNTFIGLGENFLGNLTSIVELGFQYDLIIVGGQMITMNIIEQINVLLDSDMISGTIEGVDSLVTGENYLQNSASISTTGIDTMMGITEAFAAAGEALANGAKSISEAVAADPLFAGYEALSVLYITGDLIQLNAIEQLNYLGDADQVHLALDEFLAEVGEEVTVNTGSNALLNDARIDDYGIDSVVMAGGEIYSDALIHQAELIDTDALPNGVTTALTNEAIAAFLSGDMIDPAPSSDDVGDAAPMPTDSGSLDVMQTILA